MQGAAAASAIGVTRKHTENAQYIRNLHGWRAACKPQLCNLKRTWQLTARACFATAVHAWAVHMAKREMLPARRQHSPDALRMTVLGRL